MQSVINVYMPYFTSSIASNTEDFIATLDVLQVLIDELASSAPLAIFGDFNTRLPSAPRIHRQWHRQRGFNRHSAILYDFMGHNGLTAADMERKQAVQWTFFCEALRHYTWIDHVLVPGHERDAIQSCSILPLDIMNPSDHLPISTVIRISCSTVETLKDESLFHPQPRWKDECVKTRYKDALSGRLQSLAPIHPTGGTKSLTTAANDQIEKITAHMNSAATEAGCLPSTSSTPKKWWCPALGRLRDRLRFWRQIWISIDRPRNGSVFECYKTIKREYRRTCRSCARNIQSSLDNQLNTFHRQRNSRALWNAIHKRQQMKVISNITAPEFAQHYETIMNAPGADLTPQQLSTSAAVAARERIIANNPSPSPITVQQVNDAIHRLRLNSAPGADGIRAEHLRFGLSDVLCNLLHNLLCIIF
jgi:hypothetical protein